ncbi:MAG: hypothetical protein ACJA0U_001277 [Salibacteraceae bacterium]|jgi:hypothetical protein
MKNFSTLAFALVFSPIVLFSQYLELGSLNSFEAYTGIGAVTNGGTFTGDVGTNDGVLSGFVPPSFIGETHNSDGVTFNARLDLLRVYIQLQKVFVTHPGTHAPAFGSGETITPGVYSIGGAGSVGGTLTLDGLGDPDAYFIMKFEGAITVAANSTIVLSNGTRACNVFWIAEGVISVGGNSVVKGTLLSRPGAITLGVNSSIEGRMLATEGAITTSNTSVAIAPVGPITVPVICEGFCAPSVDVLGTLKDFTLFTSDGNVSNTASSGIIGHVGTDNGIISGFSTSVHAGIKYNSDAVTAQAKIDLNSAYAQLMLIPNTVTTHTPTFGSGETLNAGVYSIAAAGSLAGTITLDGQNNPDPVFIFKFDGAFSVGAQSKVVFINGARLCNVFWISEGATDLGTFTFMKGTVIAHGGACSMAANGNLEGRMFSTLGAIGFSTGVGTNDNLCDATIPIILPIELIDFSAESKGSYVELNWITASEINNDYFNVERSIDGVNYRSISTVSSYGNSTQTSNYSIIDDSPLLGLSYYRLKQTDYDGETSYSDIEAVSFNRTKSLSLKIYPNPASSQITIDSESAIESIDIFNIYGSLVQTETASTFSVESLANGTYIVNIKTKNEIVRSHFIKE